MFTGDLIPSPGEASPMLIKELIPNDTVRALALSLARTMGIQACEKGICVHFDPKDLKEVAKLLQAARRSASTSNPKDQSTSFELWSPFTR